jgi:hypothetical protein
MGLIFTLEDQSSPQELVLLLLSLFCPFRCFPRHPVLTYPGTYKIHVSFIEALSLIQQEWAPLSFITILFLYPETEGELNQLLPDRLIKRKKSTINNIMSRALVL